MPWHGPTAGGNQASLIESDMAFTTASFTHTFMGVEVLKGEPYKAEKNSILVCYSQQYWAIRTDWETVWSN